MTIDIVLVDDHLPFRGCLSELLAHQAGFAVVAETGDGAQVAGTLQALGAARQPWGVVLMDVVLPGTDGIEATRAVARCAPTWRVLALSTHDDANFVAALAAAGAWGYMLKDDPLDELVQAIRDVAAGHRAFSRALDAAAGPAGKPAKP